MSTYKFKLFICGQSHTSEQAVLNLQLLMDERPDLECEVVIVDVLERPDLAEREGIIATPTLVRESPPPKQLLIGDLCNVSNVRQVLGISFSGEYGKK